MTDLDTGPSSIRDDSICEPSLNPNKSSGDIGERTWTPEQFWEFAAAFLGDHEATTSRTMIEDRGLVLIPAAEIERLRRELADAEFVLTDPAAFHLHALRNNVLSRMNALHIAGATDYDSLKDRALTAESAVAAAWEEAARICMRRIESHRGGMPFESADGSKTRLARIEEATWLIDQFESRSYRRPE